MFVYRYETTDGLGPYTTRWPFEFALKMAHEDLDHPGPRIDFDCYLYPYPLVPRFACPNIRLLGEWFCGWHSKLKEAGFVIARYHALDVVWGNSDKQVIFTKWDSRQVVDNPFSA
jgi:hypothetical protein